MVAIRPVRRKTRCIDKAPTDVLTIVVGEARAKCGAARAIVGTRAIVSRTAIVIRPALIVAIFPRAKLGFALRRLRARILRCGSGRSGDELQQRFRLNLRVLLPGRRGTHGARTRANAGTDRRAFATACDRTDDRAQRCSATDLRGVALSVRLTLIKPRLRVDRMRASAGGDRGQS